MRKKLIFAVCGVLLVLSGCSAAVQPQPLLTFRTALLQAETCTFSAAVTADYDDAVVQFTLDCTFSPQQGAQVCVREPESIAGIEASVQDTCAYVTFDDVQIGLGSLADGNLAPLAVPYVLGQCWAGEYIDCTGRDGMLLRATYRMGYEQQELIVDTWFEPDTMTPVRAEISHDGALAASVELSNFLIQ